MEKKIYKIEKDESKKNNEETFIENIKDNILNILRQEKSPEKLCKTWIGWHR